MRKRLIVSGNVQDVAYRAFVKFNARRLGLAGFAKNLDDGTVEVVCEGDERAILEFLKKIDRKGDPESFIDINVVSITETPAPGGPLKPFDIDYGKKLTPAQRSTKDREELAVYGASQITQGLSQVGRDVKEVGQKVDSMHLDMNTRFDHMAQRYDLIATSLVKAIDRIDAGFERMDRNSKETHKAIEQSRKETAAQFKQSRVEANRANKEIVVSNRELAKAVKFMITKLSDKPARKRPAGKRKR